MTKLDRMQRLRLDAGTTLLETYAEHRGADDVGHVLLEAYMATGKGDAFDVPSTIVDAISDLGFVIGRQGGDFGSIARDARNGDVTGVEVALILSLSAALDESVPGYNEGQTFDDLIRMASDHVAFEADNGDAADYGGPSFR
jgi:hypothetical protein